MISRRVGKKTVWEGKLSSAREREIDLVREGKEKGTK
jgi:hypothetical protein